MRLTLDSGTCSSFGSYKFFLFCFIFFVSPFVLSFALRLFVFHFFFWLGVFAFAL